MKTTRPLILASLMLGTAVLSASTAQDTAKKQPPLKSVSCPPECGFMVRSHDEKELTAMVKTHAREMHGKELTDAQVKEMMKTERPRGRQ